MSFKDVTIKNAKARDKAYKLTDENGLYLYIKPNGSKAWRLKYRFLGKEKLYQLGSTLPLASLMPEMLAITSESSLLIRLTQA